jgi:hypothetical protein
MTEITSDTSPRAIASALDRLGIEYYPADLAVREIRDPDDQPQEIETVTTGRGIGGLKLRRDDDGWSWFNRRTRSSGSLDSLAELEEQLALA